MFSGLRWGAFRGSPNPGQKPIAQTVKDLIRSLLFTAFVAFILSLPDAQNDGDTIPKQGLDIEPRDPVERGGDRAPRSKKQPPVHAVAQSEHWAKDRVQLSSKQTK